MSISRCTEKNLSKGDIPPEWFYLRDMYDKFISCENLKTYNSFFITRILSDFPYLLSLKDDSLLSDLVKIRTLDISQAPKLILIDAAIFKNVSSSFKTL